MISFLVFLVTYLPTALAAGPAMTSSSVAPSVSLYSVSGDLRPVRKWISTHKASITSRSSKRGCSKATSREFCF